MDSKTANKVAARLAETTEVLVGIRDSVKDNFDSDSNTYVVIRLLNNQIERNNKTLNELWGS